MLMQQILLKQIWFFILIFSFHCQEEQTGMMNSKIHLYQEAMNLDASTISSNCIEVKKYYELSIEAYDFLSTFSLEAMEETLQKFFFIQKIVKNSIGKLRTLGNELQEQSKQTFEQLALRDQLQETRIQHRLEELQWRVNWSSQAQSNEFSSEQIDTMKEEITQISGGRQQELDQLIEQKTNEQTQLTVQIQLVENEYNKLKADQDDLNAVITVMNDKLESNDQEMKNEIEVNSTRQEKLNTLLLQLEFFENQKKTAISFESIKQLAQLSQKTQEEINQLNQDIEETNQKILFIQESSSQAKDHLINKKAELQEVSLQIENNNQQLNQAKQQSQNINNLIQKAQQEQQTLFSQLIQQTSFLQMNQVLTDQQKELLRAQQKVQECKDRIERLEREEQMYQESSMRAEQQKTQINQKLLLESDPIKKSQLESELQSSVTQYQRSWGNYIQKKEELVKEKQLLLTFENFETSIQHDEIQTQQEQIEQKKEEQEQREEQIERQTAELENKLKLKEEEKGEACAINLDGDNNETQSIEQDDGPLIIPTIKPQEVQLQGQLPPSINPPVHEQQTPEIPQPTPPQTPEITPIPPTIEHYEPEITVQNDPSTKSEQFEPPNPSYPERPKYAYTDPIIKEPTITVEQQKEILEAEKTDKKNKIVNEVQELMRRYEELIVIKEQHIQEQLDIIVEKEEIALKHETEIHEAAEKIKQQVQQCKLEKREIINEAKKEQEQGRARLAEQEARMELNRITNELKEEFKKEGQIFKKKQEVQEKEGAIRDKQEQLDKKVQQIEEKIFKDIPKPKQSDLIKVDVDHMSPSTKPFIPVSGSTIPLAYPWEPRKDTYKDEIIVPKPEKEIAQEEIKIQQQERKAQAQKEVIEEQKQQIQKEKQEIQLKEYEIQQKEQHFEQKKFDVQQEINKLDEDIEKCKFIFGQGDSQSQEYQMCEWQSSDYEEKKKQLEQMKLDYERELAEFTKSKEQFYSQQVSFLEKSVHFINSKLQNNINTITHLHNRNKKQLAKSIRHKDGMTQLLLGTGQLAENLKNVMLQIQDNRDEVKFTLKQVLDEITKLYETAIAQRNLKQGQNKLLEQKKTLMKMQSACLEAQRILQQS